MSVNQIKQISPLAGKPAPDSLLIDVSKLIDAYYSGVPDVTIAAERVSFGTSGHRGSSFENTFNESHILAITQAICFYRTQHNINGPLFIGFDTHALSAPAFSTALEVLAANGIIVMTAVQDEYTPTPVISQAILTFNQGRTHGFADGIVITPSHNPPQDGGFKYNPPNGGPADQSITQWIESQANLLLAQKLHGVRRLPFTQARHAATTHDYDYLHHYVNDLDQIIDMKVIHDAHLRIGVDPLGGAGVHYWSAIAERYQLDLTVVNPRVDPTFRFMPVDWDGQIRMDPSSPYAMAHLMTHKDHFDITLACDTDHDRYGIVTPSAGLLPPNNYLTAAICYLFQQRLKWSASAAVGKTIVSSQMIDRICVKLNRKLYEVPVGFKWFVDGLLDGYLGFGGEESAGASFLRLNGGVWSTDKDGITATLLAAEMTARMQQDPGVLYRQLETELGVSHYVRIDAPATISQKEVLKKLLPQQIKQIQLGGSKIISILTRAPGNDAPIGGVKVMTEKGWFAARPSGTEDIYKIYAESLKDEAHLQHIVEDAQAMIDTVLNRI